MLLLLCILISPFQILLHVIIYVACLYAPINLSLRFLHLRPYRLLIWLITISVSPFPLCPLVFTDNAFFHVCLVIFFVLYTTRSLPPKSIHGDSPRPHMKVNSFKEYCRSTQCLEFSQSKTSLKLHLGALGIITWCSKEYFKCLLNIFNY